VELSCTEGIICVLDIDVARIYPATEL